jgi:hypothetical protein
MPEYMINGIPVNFPFEPYSVQSVYMEKVLECLKKVYIYICVCVCLYHLIPYYVQLLIL